MRETQMTTWTKFETAFLANDKTRDFLETWIKTRTKMASYDGLNEAVASLRTDNAKGAFADLCVEIATTFRKEDRRKALSNLKDNSPEAKKARVEAYLNSKQ